MNDIVVRGVVFAYVPKSNTWRALVSSGSKLLLEKRVEKISASRERVEWVATIEGVSGDFGRIAKSPEEAVEAIRERLLARRDDLAEVLKNL